MSSRPPRRRPPRTPRPPRSGSSGASGGDFDPYRKWLGIPPDRRPPTYYDLLGISSKEDDPETIEAAAARRKAFIRPELAGDHADAARQLTYEIEEARFGLLDPATREQHDRRLGKRRKRARAHDVAPPHPWFRPAAAAGEQSEIGRLFGVIVAILAVGCGLTYAVTFGFPDRNAVVARPAADADPGGAAAFAPGAGRNAAARPAIDIGRAAPRPEPAAGPALLAVTVVPPDAAVLAEAGGAALSVEGTGRERTVSGEVPDGTEVTLSASAPGYAVRSVKVAPPAPGGDEPPGPVHLALTPEANRVPPGPVDLLNAYEPADCTVTGEVTVERTGNSPRGRWRLGPANTKFQPAAVRFPFFAADRYRLTVTLRFEDYRFIVGLPGRGGADGGQAAVVSGPDADHTWIQRSDDQPGFRPPLVPNSGRVTLRFEVDREGVTMRNDRGAEYRWAGSWADWNRDPLLITKLPSRREIFLVSHGSAAVEEAIYEPLDGAAPRPTLTAGSAAGGVDDGVRRVSGRVIGRHRGWAAHVAALAVPGGAVAATGGEDGTVVGRDPATGRRRWSFRLPAVGEPGGGGDADGAGPVFGIHAAGGRFVVAADRRIHLLDPATGERVRSVRAGRPAGDGLYTHTAVSADGRLAVYNLSDGALEVYDLEEGRRVFAADLWTPTVGAVGDVLLLGGWEGGPAAHSAVRAGRAVGGTAGLRTRDYLGLGDRTTAVAGSAAAGLIAGTEGPGPNHAASQRRLIVWRTGGDRPLWEARHPHGWAWALAFTPDGRGLASGGGGRVDGGWRAHGGGDRATVHLWDAAAGERVAELVGAGGGANGLAFTPDGRTLLAACQDGSVHAWPIPDGLFGAAPVIRPSGGGGPNF